MDKELFSLLEKTMKHYASGDHYDTLIEAKREYFTLTGQVNDDDADYESRMNAFNDWYILQFVSRKNLSTVIDHYNNLNNIDENLIQGLRNFNHSLFEFNGSSLGGKKVLKDLLHGKKINLAANAPMPAILKKEMFTGRVITVNGQNYLLNGICILPSQIKPILLKHVKKVRKFKSKDLEVSFLLRVEYLKTKWIRYGHIDPLKIFSFNY